MDANKIPYGEWLNFLADHDLWAIEFRDDNGNLMTTTVASGLLATNDVGEDI